MKQLLLTLALASLSVLLVAQSPPPPPTPTVKTQNQQDLRGSEQSHGTTTPPQIVSSETHDISSEDKNGENGQRSTNQRIDVLAWVVAGAAVAQFIAAIAQAYYMRKGLRLTRDAADAAKTSADAATKAVENSERALHVTERAVVKIESVILRGDQTRFEDSTAVHIKLKNFGRTAANSLVVTGSLESGGKRKELGPTPVIMMAPQGNNYWTSHSLGYFLEPDDIQALRDAREGLTYQIEATYEDVFGKEHVYKASGSWNAPLKRFNIIADSST